MAQYRSFNWTDDDSTDMLNRRLMGIIEGGLYRGFDFDASSSGLTLVLSHNLTGYVETLVNGTQTPMRSKIITKQGVAIIEDAPITLQVVSNSGSANPRIDLIICDHAYTQIAGGSPAIYSVLQGTPAANPAPPALSFPAKQVAVGTIYWPANAASITDPGVIYERAYMAELGGLPKFVRITGDQTVAGTKTFLHTMGVMGSMTLTTGSGILATTVKRNYYHLAAGMMPNDYETVHTIDIAGGGPQQLNHFEVYTEQSITLVNTGNITLPAGISQMYIPAGSTFEIWALNGMPTTLTKYLAVRGDEAHKSSPSKMMAQQVWNKGTATINTSHEIILDGGGNYYEVSMDFSVHTVINGVSPTTSLSVNTVPASQGGGIIFIRLINSGSGVYTQIINGAATTAAAKPISSQSGTIREVETAALLMLLEDETTYRVLNIFSGAYNVVTVGAAVTAVLQPYEHQWLRIQSMGIANVASGGGVGELIINETGNTVFLNMVPGDQGGFFSDIKIKRGSASPVSLPAGTVVDVVITCTGFVVGLSEPPYIQLSTVMTGGIVSQVTDATRYTGASATTLHLINSSSPIGQPLRFIKSTQGAWVLANAGQDYDQWTSIEKNRLDVAALKAAPVWTAVTAFGSGWSPSVPAPEYTKDVNGLVRIRGRVKSGSSTPSVLTMIGLPIGYRSPKDLLIPIIYSAGSFAANPVYAVVWSNGDINLSFSGSWSNTYDTDLSNISYYIN